MDPHQTAFDESRRTSDENKKYNLQGDDAEGGHAEPLASYELHQGTKESDASSSQFELEQESGVSRIEALCESRSVRSQSWDSLLTFHDVLHTDTVFGLGWKLWALYMYARSDTDLLVHNAQLTYDLYSTAPLVYSATPTPSKATPVRLPLPSFSFDSHR